ncbi:MAG: hypothetical protein JW779_07410 [Candidatus Thorarchaeota archaeon]|nr:hypothetical protein [Candidatus Thorarchaeota archaeon]
MKRRETLFYATSFILIAMVSFIPVPQLVEISRETTYESGEQNRLEIAYGGPKITWVTVRCNITALIRFLYSNGTWIETKNVLLTALTSVYARFNYNGEHSTTIIEVIANAPFKVTVTYEYPVISELSLIDMIVDSFR